jgi:hypothetical protein
MPPAVKTLDKTPPADTDAALRSWLAVVNGYHLCDALMARRLGALGVRTPEHEILVNVQREPGIGQQVLAQRCFTAKSHISGLVGGRRLVQGPGGTGHAVRAGCEAVSELVRS